MDLDPILQVALNVQSNPGAYAVLLGSGVSRAAGIPTGWEVTLDLIRKVATADGEPAPPDPEAWYRARYGGEPDYSDLLDSLTRTPAERNALLRSYFEPTEEEREQGEKIPTVAHRAIAQLVRMGYIRLILTTNFDRLVESALEAEGVYPDVIATDDALGGVTPYVHSRCTVVKLHGDYRDARIKNTADELGRYSRGLTRLLERVLDEFGAIICGWSATYDPALRAAFERCKSFRYATYWLARGQPTGEAATVVRARRAAVVRVESADSFFSNLQDRVESLEELQRSDVLSRDVAVASAKRYVTEPRFRVRLDELIRDETRRVYASIPNSMRGGVQDGEVYVEVMEDYEQVSETLTAVLAAASFYGGDPVTPLLTRTVESLISLQPRSGAVALINLRWYPALRVAYGAGIGALASSRFDNLAAVLLRPQFRNDGDNTLQPAVAQLHTGYVFGVGGVLVPGTDGKLALVSGYLCRTLEPLLGNLFATTEEYQSAFDIFELLLALTFVDLRRDSWMFGNWCCPPVRTLLLDDWDMKNAIRQTPDEYLDQGLAQGSNWGLLQAGLFGGSADRLRAARQRYKAFSDSYRGGRL